jgi:hypothetical protein
MLQKGSLKPSRNFLYKWYNNSNNQRESNGNSAASADYAWYINGAAITGAGALPTAVDQDWKLVVIADLNVNGSPYVLWFNTSTNCSIASCRKAI